MTQGTRSKISIVDKSGIEKELDDTSSIYNDLTSHRLSRKDSLYTSVRGHESDAENHSLIVSHEFGLFYPIPQFNTSPQIMAFHSGKRLCLQKLKTVSYISQLSDAFFAQALRINMHEYFSGQVCFDLYSEMNAFGFGNYEVLGTEKTLNRNHQLYSSYIIGNPCPRITGFNVF